MKTICIYHSRDLDGWMSAAIVKLINPDIELFGWDYGQTLPELPSVNCNVIMTDISFPRNNMRHLIKKNNLIWIDHHISAIKDIAEMEPLPFIKGLRNEKKAACELTWEYFFPDTIMPELVRLLGRYDCFGHKGTEEERKVLEFQYGARQLIYDVETALINLFMASSGSDNDEVVCKNILKDGKAIYNYLCTEARGIYKRKFDINFDGYKFACVNQDRFNPINFGIDYHKEGYDGFACFWYVNGQWTYSLYNDNEKVDCSVICKTRGGGGHKGAAGFITNEIIIK
jgi:uncharacterized protein